MDTTFLRSFKGYLLSFPLLRNLHELRFDTPDLLYKPDDLNDKYYEKVLQSGDIELEHQIGRLTNYKTIVAEIASQRLAGDIIEFGTWKGFSLLWISYLCERQGLLTKQIVGLDGFVGLPMSEGDFKKGAFSDATLAECRRNLVRNKSLYEITRKHIFVHQPIHRIFDS
jgi:hypothetical protein